MASITVQIDPLSEDAANSALDLEDATNGYRVMAADWDDPEDDLLTAGSADTEGDPLVSLRPHDRHPALTVRIQKSTAAALDTAVGQLQQKIGKLNREGGTLKRTTAGGNTGILDIRTATMSAPDDWVYVNRNTVMIPLKLVARPYWRGAEQTLGAFSFTGVGSVVYTGVLGDVPALGRALITEGAGADQWHLHSGVRSAHYSNAATNALVFEAETRLPQGGAVTAALAGASGGTAVYQGTLTPSYQSMLSLASSGTVYPQHVGDYNVWARLYRPTSNAGTVTAALEWAEGDFTRFTRNGEIVFGADEREGGFTLAQFGQVHLSKAHKGSQRWDGRIIAKSSTAGDDLYVDRVWLQPVGEGASEITVLQQLPSPTVFSARDEFDQTAGSLTGKAAAVGGTYVALAGSDTDDFTIDTSGHTAQRTAVSDTGSGAVGGLRVVGLDLNLSATAARLDWTASVDGQGTRGIFARVVDASNFLAVVITAGASNNLLVASYLSGSLAAAKFVTVPITSFTSWQTLEVLVDAAGRWYVWMGPQGARPTFIASGSDSVLATGGALATGDVYMADGQDGATAVTRNYDNFTVWVPTPDAALFASKQAELRSDSYIRQDAAGAVWAAKTIEGDYFTLPPAGREGRSDEFLLCVSRGDPDTMFDPALDAVAGTVYATPRYRSIPAP